MFFVFLHNKVPVMVQTVCTINVAFRCCITHLPKKYLFLVSDVLLCELVVLGVFFFWGGGSLNRLFRVEDTKIESFIKRTTKKRLRHYTDTLRQMTSDLVSES